MSPEKAVAALGEPCLFVGNGAVLYWKLILDTLKDNALIAQPWQHFVRGATVAQIGLVKMRQRLFEDVSCFGPVYLRKSDAEVNLERRARFTRT
jgi:hypothetical protein